MSAPKISESLNRFFAVVDAKSKFSANDVINIRGGKAQKAGTFRKWNIFRRLGRSDAEVNANNNTRQQFLDALKESLGLSEKGQALVDKLANILGKEVFKPEDYTFKGGKLDCGKPLTTRRITDVSAKLLDMRNKMIVEDDAKASRAVHDLSNRLSLLYTLSDSGKIPKLTDAELGNVYATISDIQTQTEEWNDALSKNRYVGFSASLRLAVDLLDRSHEDRDVLFNAIMTEMKGDARFAEAYERHEKLIDRHYSLLGIERPANDGLDELSNRMTVGGALGILKLSPNVTMVDVRKAYKTLVSENHPDKLFGIPENQKQERVELYQKIVGAYKFLVSEFEKGRFGKKHGMPPKEEPGHSIPQPPPSQDLLAIGNGDPEAEREFLTGRRKQSR